MRGLLHEISFKIQFLYPKRPYRKRWARLTLTTNESFFFRVLLTFQDDLIAKTELFYDAKPFDAKK